MLPTAKHAGDNMKTFKPKSILRLIIVSLFALLVGFVITEPARALENDTDGYIPADEVINDDLLISAENVIIEGTVNGDTIVAGETVTINGTINGNLIVNGGLVEINGTINGSTASFGQRITVNGLIVGSLYSTGVELILNPTSQIGRNILFAAFSAHTLHGSSIGTDLHGTAYQAILEGSIGRDVFVDAMAVEVSGEIGGDGEFHVSDPSETPPNMVWLEFWLSGSSIGKMPDQLSPGLRVSPGAEITGELKYQSKIEQDETILAEPGSGVTFTQISTIEHNRSQAGEWLLARLRDLLTLSALGSLAIWLIPNAVINSSQALRTKPLPSFGWGILGLILSTMAIFGLALLILLVGILMAIVTLGGLAGAVFGIGFAGLIMVAGILTLLIIYGSKIVFAYLVGTWIISRFSPENIDLRWVALFVGIAIYMIFRFIPFISFIVGIIAMLFGFGAMVIAFKERKKSLTAVSNQEPVISEL